MELDNERGKIHTHTHLKEMRLIIILDAHCQVCCKNILGFVIVEACNFRHYFLYTRKNTQPQN
jgi:hypothetical protein